MLAIGVAFGVEVFLQHAPMGDRFAAAGADGHFLARRRMAVDRLVDGTFGIAGRAPDKGKITAL